MAHAVDFGGVGPWEKGRCRVQGRSARKSKGRGFDRPMSRTIVARPTRARVRPGNRLPERQPWRPDGVGKPSRQETLTAQGLFRIVSTAGSRGTGPDRWGTAEVLFHSSFALDKEQQFLKLLDRVGEGIRIVVGNGCFDPFVQGDHFLSVFVVDAAEQVS